MATADLGRVVGSKWYVGTAITGQSTTPTSYDTGITYAFTTDLYLNTTSSNVYQCSTPGDEETAEWVYVTCIKGLTPSVVNSLQSTSTTSALSANMGKTLFDKLLDSGVYAQEVIIDELSPVYSVTMVVENKNATLTFSTADASKTYSVTKSGTSETQTVVVTIQSLGFGTSGAVLTSISSSENIYSVELHDSDSTLQTLVPNLWQKVNDLDTLITQSGVITEGATTLRQGVVKKTINGAKEQLYPITHAKSVWFNKTNNRTIYDEINNKTSVSVSVANETLTITS